MSRSLNLCMHIHLFTKAERLTHHKFSSIYCLKSHKTIKPIQCSETKSSVLPRPRFEPGLSGAHGDALTNHGTITAMQRAVNWILLVSLSPATLFKLVTIHFEQLTYPFKQLFRIPTEDRVTRHVTFHFRLN